MAESGWQDFKRMASMAYQKYRSHPIGQIEDTMRTGKPPAKRDEPAPRPKARAKSPAKGRR